MNDTQSERTEHQDCPTNEFQKEIAEKLGVDIKFLISSFSPPIPSYLSIRILNTLESAGIKTVGDLVGKSESEMLRYRNFGRDSLREVKRVLRSMGLSFNMDMKNIARFLLEPERTKQLEKILAVYIEEGDFQRAVDTAELLNRKLTPNELLVILPKYMKGKGLSTAKEIIVLLPENQRDEWLLRLLLEYLEERRVDEAKEVALFLPKNQLREALTVCVEKGRLKGAQIIAGLFCRKLRNKELQRILTICIIERRFGEAREVAKLFPRIVRRAYLDILKYC